MTATNMTARTSERCLDIQADGNTSMREEGTSISSCDSTVSQTIGINRKKIVQNTLLLLALFTVYSGYSMISPFFPQQAKSIGLTETEIGVIFAFFSAVVFVMSPIYGALIVRLTPKFLCVAGCFLCGGCCILFGVLGHLTDRTMLLVISLIVRGVEGNGSAMINVAASSLVIKSFPERTGMMSSLVEAALGLGFIAGPAIGSAFFTIGGYALPFLVVGGVTLLTSLLLFIFLDSSVDVEQRSNNFLRLLIIPGVFVMFLHFSISSLVMTFLDPVLSDWMSNTFAVDASIVGLIFASWSLAYVLMTPICGKMVDKGYVFSTMIFGVITSAAVYLFMAPSPLLDPLFHGQSYLWVVIVVCILEGAFNAAMYVPCYQATLNIAEVYGYELSVQTIGLVSGLMNSGCSLGSMAGPLLSGYLTDQYSFAWATTIMTFTLLAMGVVEIVYVTAMKCASKPLVLTDSKESEIEENRPLLS